MSDKKMYDILGHFRNQNPELKKVEEAVKSEPVYEEVEAKGSIMEAIKNLGEKFAMFKEAKAKPDFLDVDGDGNKKEPFKKAVKDKKAVKEGQGPYELYNPKHPKFKANYEKYKAKHPDCTLAEFVAAMKKREAKMNEGKFDEPAAPDADAIAKRKRLQAIKDRQEDERGSYGSEKSNVRKVAGKAYGGSAQKDAPEADDLDEAGYSAKAGRAGKDLGKPGKNFSKIAKGAAKRYGSKAAGERVAGAVLNKLRHGSEELDEYSQEEYNQALGDFKAKGGTVKQLPPGSAKNPISTASRHIAGRGEAGKGKPAGRGAKIDPKGKPVVDVYEKAVSKAQQKFMGMVHAAQQGEKAASPEVAKVAKGMSKKAATDYASTKHKGLPQHVQESKQTIKESRMMEGEYDYEKVGRLLAKDRPGLDTNSSEFREAVYAELKKMGIPAKHAQYMLSYDPDFLGDAATSYGYFCKHQEDQMAESGPVNTEELDEIARLAGLPAKESTCMECGMLESSCACSHEEELDEREQFQSMPKSAPASAPAAPAAKPGVSYDKSKLNPMEEEMETEGNEFSGALAKAKATGAKDFEVGGKKYTVKEDVNLNITANGEEDVLALIKQLAGLEPGSELASPSPIVAPVGPGPTPADLQAIETGPELEPVDAEAAPEVEVAEDGPNIVNAKPRKNSVLNTPREEYAASDITTKGGSGYDRNKKTYRGEWPGDNPMDAYGRDGTQVKEEALWKSYENMIETVKK